MRSDSSYRGPLSISSWLGAEKDIIDDDDDGEINVEEDDNDFKEVEELEEASSTRSDEKDIDATEFIELSSIDLVDDVSSLVTSSQQFSMIAQSLLSWWWWTLFSSLNNLSWSASNFHIVFFAILFSAKMNELFERERERER